MNTGTPVSRDQRMLDPELLRLVSHLRPTNSADLDTLRDAGLELDFDWPADYVALMAERNGGEGDIGEWWVRLWPAEDLVRQNREYQTEAEFYPGAVLFGSDGGGEAFAFDKATGDVLLVPFIGGEEDWIRLGSTLQEAFQHLERDDVFDDPVQPRGRR